MKIFKIVCWFVILGLHWAFVQNDFFDMDIKEDEVFEIYFDIFFFLAWLMGLLSMT